ncbi:MAG: hypothetical protein LBO04_02220 [Spirochaetaceae bacterium]|jgi:hypothetical protein|nr:hypothetical protein [Spirochaetaceae bacterium]
MKKQGLILGFAAALLGAAFILAGCEQETKTEYVNVPVPGAYQVPDYAVLADSTPELLVLLADTSGLYDHIVYKAVPGADITVPAGKTLYLSFNVLTLANDITVDGTVVVYGTDTNLTPDAYFKAGAGTLLVEEGTVTVTGDTLFTGDDKPATVSIKKGAWLKNTSTTALADDDDLAAWVGYAGEGSLEITQPIVANVTPKAAIDAIGTLPDKKTVKLKVNVTPTETSLSVPAGVNLTTDNALTAVTSLTVNGTLNAESATLAAAGASITLGSKSSTTLGTVAKLAADVTVPANAAFIVTTITNFDSKTVTFKKGGTSGLLSDIDLTFSAYSIENSTDISVTLADSITLAANQNIAITPPGNGSIKITVPAGKKIINAGTITLSPGVSLVLATTSATSVAGIGGAGKIVAGATEITGAWDAVTATEAAGTLTIASAAAGATITAEDAATGLKAVSAGAVITQKAGYTIDLTIAESTEVVLGGTDSAKAGEIVLTGGTNPGKLKLAAANAKITGITPSSGDTVAAGSVVITGGTVVGSKIAGTTNAAGAKKLGTITGDTDNNTVTGSTTEGANVSLNSTVDIKT